MLDFPTRVGVNRSSRGYSRSGVRFPHTRGGEPSENETATVAH